MATFPESMWAHLPNELQSQCRALYEHFLYQVPSIVVPKAALAEMPDLRLVPGAVYVVRDIEVVQPLTFMFRDTPPDGEGLTLEQMRQTREMLEQEACASVVADLFYCSEALPRSLPPPIAPTAYPLSGSGFYGDGEREIPDTPLDEWTAGVEALLAACAAWGQQVDKVLQE